MGVRFLTVGVGDYRQIRLKNCPCGTGLEFETLIQTDVELNIDSDRYIWKY